MSGVWPVCVDHAFRPGRFATLSSAFLTQDKTCVWTLPVFAYEGKQERASVPKYVLCIVHGSRAAEKKRHRNWIVPRRSQCCDMCSAVLRSSPGSVPAATALKDVCGGYEIPYRRLPCTVYLPPLLNSTQYIPTMSMMAGTLSRWRTAHMHSLQHRRYKPRFAKHTPTHDIVRPSTLTK